MQQRCRNNGDCGRLRCPGTAATGCGLWEDLAWSWNIGYLMCRKMVYGAVMMNFYKSFGHQVMKREMEGPNRHR